MNCDPCRLCRYYAESYDRHTGVTDCGCCVDSQWEGPENGACPDFRPRFVSDDLLEQLWNEECYREMMEEEE